MANLGDLEAKQLSAADEHFRQYERLMSSWIDVFLETQKSVITHSPTLDKIGTVKDGRAQEVDSPSKAVPI